MGRSFAGSGGRGRSEWGNRLIDDSDHVFHVSFRVHHNLLKVVTVALRERRERLIIFVFHCFGASAAGRLDNFELVEQGLTLLAALLGSDLPSQTQVRIFKIDV